MDDLLIRAGWIAAGLTSAGVAVLLKVTARKLESRAADERPRTYARRRTKLKAEMTSRAVLLPLAVMLFALAGIWSAPEVRYVSGKPVEMRSRSRLVVMPDGGFYTFSCGTRSSRCSREEKEAWNQLPRWPEPSHVEMLVSGHEINSFMMDGQTIVDRAPQDERVGFVIIGFGLLAYAMISISLRALKLRKIPLRARERSPASPQTR